MGVPGFVSCSMTATVLSFVPMHNLPTAMPTLSNSHAWKERSKLYGWLVTYSLPIVLETNLYMAAVKRSGRSAWKSSKRSNSGMRFQSPAAQRDLSTHVKMKRPSMHCPAKHVAGMQADKQAAILCWKRGEGRHYNGGPQFTWQRLVLRPFQLEPLLPTLAAADQVLGKCMIICDFLKRQNRLPTQLGQPFWHRVGRAITLQTKSIDLFNDNKTQFCFTLKSADALVTKQMRETA